MVCSRRLIQKTTLKVQMSKFTSRYSAHSRNLRHRSPDCKKLGRGVPKLVSLFVNLTNLIDEADKNLLAESDEDAEDLFEGLTEDEAKRRKRR